MLIFFFSFGCLFLATDLLKPDCVSGSRQHVCDEHALLQHSFYWCLWAFQQHLPIKRIFELHSRYFLLVILISTPNVFYFSNSAWPVRQNTHFDDFVCLYRRKNLPWLFYGNEPGLASRVLEKEPVPIQFSFRGKRKVSVWGIVINYRSNRTVQRLFFLVLNRTLKSSWSLPSTTSKVNSSDGKKWMEKISRYFRACEIWHWFQVLGDSAIAQ